MGAYPTRREALETEVDGLRAENKRLSSALRELRYAEVPLRERAEALYREGWSNRRISEALGITLQEARRLTFSGK